MTVPEAPLDPSEHGFVPAGEGWFVLNAKDARRHLEGTGQQMAMYHWEDEQEDFLVISGEALLVVEGQERPLRAWDLAHCPNRTKQVIIGAGNLPARQPAAYREGWPP